MPKNPNKIINTNEESKNINLILFCIKLRKFLNLKAIMGKFTTIKNENTTAKTTKTKSLSNQLTC